MRPLSAGWSEPAWSTLTQPVMEAALKAANELYAEQSAKNADFKKAYDSMVAYRSEVLPWWQLNEYAYDTFMIRTRGRVERPPRKGVILMRMTPFT